MQQSGQSVSSAWALVSFPTRLLRWQAGYDLEWKAGRIVLVPRPVAQASDRYVHVAARPLDVWIQFRRLPLYELWSRSGEKPTDANTRALVNFVERFGAIHRADPTRNPEPGPVLPLSEWEDLQRELIKYGRFTELARAASSSARSELSFDGLRQQIERIPVTLRTGSHRAAHIYIEFRASDVLSFIYLGQLHSLMLGHQFGVCPNCNDEFRKRRMDHRFCSNSCRVAWCRKNKALSSTSRAEFG